LTKRVLMAIAVFTAAVCATPSPAASKSAWPTTPKLPAAPPVTALPVAPSLTSAPPPLLTTYGGSEHVRIGESPAIQITADLDPGAKQSLLYATGISYFMKEGDLWVGFTIDNGSVLPGNRTTLKRKILKDQHVRERGGGIGHEPLVAVDICIGTVTLPVQVTVKQRTGYISPLRLSRVDIDRLGAVDPVLKFTEPPECAVPQPAKPGSVSN